MKSAKCLGGTNSTWFVPVSTRNRAGVGCETPRATPPDVTQKLRLACASTASSGSALAQASVPGCIASIGTSPKTICGPLRRVEGTRLNRAFRPCSWKRWYTGSPATASRRQAKPQIPSQERCTGNSASSTMMNDWFLTVQEEPSSNAS
eukprot:CAMPEP_0172733038 /NCGR_PEP_ID=MMETSP1074-20121228/106010_1 /TAXON_ID=2916 /ORGANISM="Ceratium fusus, Strain PA161109" /LENGTH=148 /DNA_ID=CAMNT_0013561463 /DNA_START=1027 /DNA_END=1473 /DNA_ORIENTATION=+